MSTETEDERIERLERALRQHSAIHRRRMRWWKHAREYLSIRRLVLGGLVQRKYASVPLPVLGPAHKALMEYVDKSMTALAGEMDKRAPVGPVLPDHPPWSSNWWQAERPIRFVRKGRG